MNQEFRNYSVAFIAVVCAILSALVLYFVIAINSRIEYDYSGVYIDTSKIKILYKDNALDIVNKNGKSLRFSIKDKSDDAFLNNFYDIGGGLLLPKFNCPILDIELDIKNSTNTDNFVRYVKCVKEIENNKLILNYE